MTPSGLVVILASAGKWESQYLQALNNAFISGVAVQINWRDIEPAEGKPDWSKLDELFAAAESAHKWVHVAIVPGFFSPAWALEGAKTDQFPVPYGPAHGTVMSLPMPWDTVYLNRWFAFLKQVGAKYGGYPAFRMIAAAGPTSVSEETTLPANSGPAINKWRGDGYTSEKYLGAWDETLHVYADAFPNQCVSLAGAGGPIIAMGKPTDRAARQRTKQDFVSRAVQVLGRRLAIQENDLHAGQVQVEAADDLDFIKSYSGRIITGFEMRGGSQGARPSEAMGAAGDPALALRKSVDKGMAPNSAGKRVNYLEIYLIDVLPADMQPTLQYAASLFH